AGVALIVVFYSGTFFHWNGIKGLYQAYLPWFKTGSEGHGHEKSWYYWLALISHYELPVLAGLLLCIFALRFKAMNLRYLAIYGVACNANEPGDYTNRHCHSRLLVARALHLAELLSLHHRHRALRLRPDLQRHLQIDRSVTATGPFRSPRISTSWSYYSRKSVSLAVDVG